MNTPGLHDIEQKITAFTEERFSYRYYARRTPGQEWPAVYSGDIAGPNCFCYGTYRTMLQAHVIAWWRNRRRGKRGCAAYARKHIYPATAEEAFAPQRIVREPVPAGTISDMLRSRLHVLGPPQGFAADADPPYGHDCGPECTCFDLPGPFDPDSPPAPGYVMVVPHGNPVDHWSVQMPDGKVLSTHETDAQAVAWLHSWAPEMSPYEEFRARTDPPPWGRGEAE